MGPGFSHLWNQLQGKGLVPGFRRKLPESEGIWGHQNMELCMGVYVYLGIEFHYSAPAILKLTAQTKPASHLQQSPCLILLKRPPHPVDSRLSRETPAVSRGGKGRLTGCGRNLSFQGEEKKGNFCHCQFWG